MTFSDLIAQAEERLSVPRLSVDDHTDADIRVIAAFLDLFASDGATAMNDAKFLDELRGRRARASLDAGGRDAGRAAAAEVTTVEDVDRLSHIAKERGALIVHLAYTHTNVWADFRFGNRCMVCGMTKAQAADANYDCTKEC